MIYGYQNYRTYLRDRLADQMAKNPSYSLRAMAKKMGLAPSGLSCVMRGLKNLSEERALQVCDALGLKGEEKSYFVLLVQIESAKTIEYRATLLEKLNQLSPQKGVRDLSVDAFKTIADWYHFPILEMTNLKNFEFTPEAIAEKLGISSPQAASAMDRLERLELLAKNSKGRYHKTDTFFRVESPEQNEALRKFHQYMLERSSEALENQKPEERFVGSETFAIKQSSFSQFKKDLDTFLSAMAAKYASSEADDVVHLGVQSFKITQKPSRSKK